MTRRILSGVLLVLTAGMTSSRSQSADEWPQFAGPFRNFHAPSSALADTWPEDGPRQIWSRGLGEGFSGIAVADGSLYTMYRRAGDEVIVALEAATGRTRWEHAAPAGSLEAQDLSQGAGPHVTPTLAGDLVCGIGVTARLRCLDRATGRLRWSHDLVAEYGATPVFRGYSSSPVVFRDLLIVQAGGKTHGVIAFELAGGAVRWHGGARRNANSSPVVGHSRGGEAQLVAFFADVVAGYDLTSGAELWAHPHPQRFNDSIAAPILIDGDVVVSSALDGGTRRVATSRAGVPARERWHQPRFAVYYTNLAAVDGMIVGSSGGLGPTFFTAVEATTGNVLWQTRDIKRSNFVVLGSELVLRDEDGALILARVARDGVDELARAQLFVAGAPSPPTLAGSTLYARDRERIAAFHLGPMQ